jgi:hypothetical protein
MIKNQASQIAVFFAFDTTTSAPKTGDAANMTPYVIKDDGTAAALATATVTEIDATNLKGYYRCSPSQAETNYNDPIYGGKSSTANVSIVATHYSTTPANFHKTVIDASGNVNANLTQRLAIAELPRYTGTAQNGGASTITLQAGTTALQCCAGDTVVLTGGAGLGQSGIVSAFDPATVIATIVGTWPTTNPNNTSTYELLKVGGGVPASPADIWGATDAPVRTLTAATNLTSTGGTIPMSAAGNAQVDVVEVKEVALQLAGSGTQNIGGP